METSHIQHKRKERWVPINLYEIIVRKRNGEHLTTLELNVYQQWRLLAVSKLQLVPYLKPDGGEVVFKEAKKNYYRNRQSAHLL